MTNTQIHTTIAFLVLSGLPSWALADDPPARGAHSTTPARGWEAGFVTGNGRLGAMLFGDPTNETIVANH